MTTKETLYLDDALAHAQFMAAQCREAANALTDPELRRQAYQYDLPVVLEENVWVGAGATILPGVTIGKNSVIGAGSVVDRDIPPDVVAAGVPCRVLREIGPRDREYYHKDWPVKDGLA